MRVSAGGSFFNTSRKTRERDIAPALSEEVAPEVNEVNDEVAPALGTNPM